MSLNETPDYTVRLPWPPSINGYWRNSGKRQVISQKGRKFRTDAITAIVKQRLFGTNLKCKLAAKATLYPPTKAKRDIDNFIKAPLDALEHGKVYLNDSQIDRLLIVRGDTKRGGEVVIHLWKI